MSTRYGATRTEVTTLLAAWGEPRYRATQVWEALYARRDPIERATALPGTLRNRLAERFPLALSPVAESRDTSGSTIKWRWEAGSDRAQVETVLMGSRARATVCVSSQAGCAMGCTFCATGQAGFERQLGANEIVEQVLRAQHASPVRVSNVVYMGMGEPLANYDPVWESVERLHRELGLSARRLTISTVGVVPAMRRLAHERLPVTLAVSLHAPDDRLRDTLVPLNRRYPLGDVLDAARECSEARGRRVTFEYALMAGINDRPDQADALGRVLRGFRGVGGAHVNLIPLNPTEGFATTAPPRLQVRSFAARLRATGLNVTLRRNRGVEIDAACGQLRLRALRSGPRGPGRGEALALEDRPGG